jgi:integrase
MSRSSGKVFRRGSTWYLDYWVETDEVDPGTGKRKTRRVKESAKTTVKSEAVELLHQRMSEARRGPAPAARGVTTFEDLEEYILLDYQRMRRKSMKRLRTSLGHLRDSFAGWKARDITYDAIERHWARRDREGAAPSSIQKELAALKRAMRLARKRGAIAYLPEFPTVKVSNVRTNLPSLADVERICSHLPAELARVTRFGALTGIRKTRILELEWRQVLWPEQVIRLDPGTTKNDEGREIPFGEYPALRAVLVEALEATREVELEQGRRVPRVFHRAGKPIREMRRAWSVACHAAGVPGTVFHDLRRTAVRLMMDAGLTRRQAMALTGHKTESMFERYNIAAREEARRSTAKMGQAVAAQLEQKDAQDGPIPLRSGTEG